MSRYVFKYNINEKYGANALHLYNVIKDLRKNEYKYICSFKRDEALDYHNATSTIIKKFLLDNEIDFFSPLSKSTIELSAYFWVGIKNKEDLKTINLLMPLMCKFKLNHILKVSLLEKYEIACNKYQGKTHEYFRNIKFSKVQDFFTHIDD